MSEKLASTIQNIAKGIAAGRFQSEAAISQGVVTRILAELGWDVYDTQVVTPQFPIGNSARKVDYALCHPPREAAILIEVKDLGKADEKGEKQLFEYCFHEGVHIAILTDGCLWNFFFPAGGGKYQERLFAQINLLGHDHHVAASTLARYLNMENIRSQTTWEWVRQDHKQAKLERKAASKFVPVWDKLLSEPAKSSLLDLFLKEVEKEAKTQPNSEQAAAFIREQALSRKAMPPTPPKNQERLGNSGTHNPQQPHHPTRKSNPPPQIVKPDKKNTSRQASFTFRGQTQEFRSGNELLGTLFTMFAEMDPYFCRRYSETHLGRSKKYVAQTREELHPTNPNLRQALPLPGGWWISTLCSNAQKMQRIREACSLLNLEFGRDLVVNLPNA